MAPERVYDDAFTLHQVVEKDEDNFNFVFGMVPFMQNMCIDVSMLGSGQHARSDSDFLRRNSPQNKLKVLFWAKTSFMSLAPVLVYQLQGRNGVTLGPRVLFNNLKVRPHVFRPVLLLLLS